MGKIIELPKAEYETGVLSLEKLLAHRRSCRNFAAKPLSIEQISRIMWSAQGKAEPGEYRTCPSAGATYPLEVYAVTQEGLYHYEVEGHRLEQVSDRDLRKELAGAAFRQQFVAEAPLVVVFAAKFARTTRRYGQRGLRYVYMEAGHAAQNVHLQAEALGLGSVAVGAFDDDAAKEVLSVPAELDVIYMVAVGHRR